MVASAPELLHTKLTPPPVRADRILRPRLTERFSAGLEHPLTLVCAPAGYGKTTLLSEWLVPETERQLSLAWLSLDEDDNDPARFLTYLVSALSSAGATDSDEVLSLLLSPQPPSPKVVLTALISRLEAFPHRIVLILDDYHLITAQSIHEAITFLLDHLPDQMCLVITTREDPPFPLSRLRGRDQLAEIRADDLRFTPEEAGQFLEQMLGVRLSVDQVNELGARTEGWIAGLQLAALAMKGREDIASFLSAFTGSHRFILDYLTEEVLSRQPENIQSFLLQTSVLSRLSGPLCDAVTGRTDGQAMLEQIERGNLFLIALDDERYWYRYHQLFGDMLRNRFKQVAGREADELHRRASHWLLGEKLFDEAVSHALAARDYELAASIMEESGSRYFVESWGNFGLKWTAQIPDEVMRHHPLLALNSGMWHSYLGQSALAQKDVDTARAALTTMPFSASEQEELLGYADTIEALSASISYDSQRAFDAAESALQRLPQHRIRLRGTALLVKGYVYQRERLLDEAHAIFAEVIEIGRTLRDLNMTTRAMLHNAEIFLMQGQLRDAESAYHGIIRTATEGKQEHLLNVGIAYGELSIIQFERNQLGEAAMSAARSVERCDPIIPYYALVGYAVSARIHHLSGNVMACQRAIQSIHSILENYPSIPARIYVLFVTRLWLRDEVFPGIRQFLTRQNSTPTTVFETVLLQLVTLRSVIEQMRDGAPDEARTLLDSLRPQVEAIGSITCSLEMLIFETLMLNTLQRPSDALNALECALDLAEPERFARIFIDEGETMAGLLRAAHAKSKHKAYIDELLPAFETTPQRNGARSGGDHNLEALSERELEVLHLIAEGASNREIAQQLFVSIGTVKKHLNNIFLKLDAHNRTQAIATARKENLL